MKKLLLLALMAGLVFGECKIGKKIEFDKMTDEIKFGVTCKDENNNTAFFKLSKKDSVLLSGEVFSYVKGDKDYKLLCKEDIIDRMCLKQELRIRFNKDNPIKVITDPNSPENNYGFIAAMEQKKPISMPLKTLLIEYYDHNENKQYTEIDISNINNQIKDLKAE